MITFFSLAFSSSVVLGSIQLYWMHSRYARFLLALRAGWLLKVKGRLSSFLGLKSRSRVRLGAKVFCLCFEGVMAEFR
jgi:hypothetical protein